MYKDLIFLSFSFIIIILDEITFLFLEKINAHSIDKKVMITEI